MEFSKTINLLDTASNNKDLRKNRPKSMINKKKKYSVNKEIKIERPIIVLNIKHNTII